MNCARSILMLAQALLLFSLVSVARASGQQIVHSGPLLDRIVAAIGNSAVTESDVLLEYRFELFQKGEMPRGNPSPAEFQSAMESVINQRMLAVAHPSPADRTAGFHLAIETLRTIRDEFGGQARFNEALRQLGWSKAQAELAIARRLQAMIAMEQRFQRQAEPSDQQMADYYRSRFSPQFVKQYKHDAPPLSQIQDQVRAIVIQQNMLRLLDAWLVRERTVRNVRIYRQ